MIVQSVFAGIDNKPYLPAGNFFTTYCYIVAERLYGSGSVSARSPHFTIRNEVAKNFLPFTAGLE